MTLKYIYIFFFFNAPDEVNNKYAHDLSRQTHNPFNPRSTFADHTLRNTQCFSAMSDFFRTHSLYMCFNVPGKMFLFFFLLSLSLTLSFYLSLFIFFFWPSRLSRTRGERGCLKLAGGRTKEKKINNAICN